MSLSVYVSFKVKIRSLSIFGGTLNAEVHEDIKVEKNCDLRVAALTSTGDLYLWHQSDPTLRQCLLSADRTVINHVHLNSAEMLLTTSTGKAFTGVLKPRKKNTVEINADGEETWHVKHRKRNKSESDINVLHVVKMKKVATIHRAYCFQSDPRGHNFAVLQV